MNDNNFNSERVQSAEQFEQENMPPYPDLGDTNPDDIADFTSTYNDVDDINDDQVWVLSGRVRRQNDFGDFIFYDIDDRTDSVQVMCSVDERSDFETDNFDMLQNISMGDQIVFRGYADRSNTGELTLNAVEYTVSSVSLQDTADEWSQMNEENQIVNRTGALVTDDELYNNISGRFEIVQSVRNYLNDNGYTEVQTPTLHNQSGGASATPFETYCESLDQDVYLRIAPELYLKRLIIGGFDSIYEISDCFRNESIDTTHNPEFTMLELYETYSGYNDMMDLVEDMFYSIAVQYCGGSEISYDGVEIDLSPPWNRVTFDSLIEDVFDEEVSQIEPNTVVNYLVEQHNINRNELRDMSFDELLMEVFEEQIEDNIEQPTFVTNYPSVSTPLCQSVEGRQDRVQRFEAFICGLEVANSYTELTDPREQYNRLLDQANGDEDEVNTEFVEALAYGMPPTAGLGIGIDRLVMILTGVQSIKDIVTYPMTHSRI